MMKRHVFDAAKWALAALALLLAFLCGCGGEEDGTVTIRVLTNAATAGMDPADRYNMDYEIKRLAENYEAEHAGVVIQLESLPSDGEERELRLEQLRTEIMAGDGPDLFLMSAYRWTYDSDTKTHYRKLDGDLFHDVTQSMYNGLFYDISAYYDADEALDTQGLVTGVMDAGTIGDARYVLPIRYNFSAAFLDGDALEHSTLDGDVMAASANGFYQELLASRHPDWVGLAFGLGSDPFYVFPGLIDYETESVRLTPEELAEHLRQRVAMNSAITAVINGMGSASWSGGLVGYIQFPEFILYHKEPNEETDGPRMRKPHLCTGSLNDALDNAAIAKYEGIELEMFPLRAADGSLTAYITWWGAVYGGSRHPDAAYDFLRLLLLPETQWELERPYGGPRDMESEFMDTGWPVRAAGSVEPLWQWVTGKLEIRDVSGGGASQRKRAFRTMTMTDEDLRPLLEAEVDEARFLVSWGEEIDEILNGEIYRPGADLDALAQEILSLVRWHLAEG